MKLVPYICLVCFTSFAFAWDNNDIDDAWRSENTQKLAQYARGDDFTSLYAHYRVAMVAINKDDKKTAKTSLDTIKDALKDNYQNSDEAALYSASLGLSITLKPWQAAFIAGGAEDALEYSFANQENHAPTLMVKGIAMYNTPSLLGGDKAQALNYFDQAIALYRAEPAWGYEDALLWRVKALQALGNSQEARKAHDELKGLYPDFVEANTLDLSTL